MSKKNQKYYVVWEGNLPGIYNNWPDVLKQITGHAKPVFKSFANPDIARKAFADDPTKYLSDNYFEPETSLFDLSSLKTTETPIWESISVDAACAGNPGVLEYQGVETKTKKLLFKLGPFPLGTQNIGEFLALVHGLAYLTKNGSSIPVYSDSMTALTWLSRKQIKTTLERNQKTEELFKILDRALVWLKSNSYNNPVLKWKTEIWGEIPADFGRK